MTTQQLEATGFICNFEEKSIEATTYRDYLLGYGQDLTTSPHGIADRMHTREVKDDEGNTIEWQIWSWGTGNNPYYIGTSFDNEEDATLYYYERCEWYINEKNWDAPIFHDTKEEAIEDMANSLDKPTEVVVRYLAISAITARKNAEHREKINKENAERKEKLAIEVPAEAATIKIDQIFVDGVKLLKNMEGQEKSNSSASMMKSLLQRNNIEKIKSDFWQVFRILKANAEKI